MATKVVLLCSGGLDSTTLLAQAVQTYGAQQVLRFQFFTDKSITANCRLLRR